jgi:TolB-like protein/DNA-binding winged helix-turn-helix (wHTH) protein/Flp pilus assembly protein TadD
MKTTTSRTAMFGPYALDVQSGELRKFGRRMKMGEQTFQILFLLLERSGEVVSREELRAKLWADDTFVDFDHGLNSAIQRLRDCLADSAGKPRWVETLPRRGYRFVGQVEWSEKTDANGRTVETLQTESTASINREPWHEITRKWRWFSLSGCVIIVAFVAGWLVLQRHRPTNAIHSLAVLPLDNLSGDSSQEYFADGITDELITKLAKYSTLRLVSRTSVMQYKGARRPLREIARALDVDGVIEGSISRIGSHVHMTLQLIRCDTDTHLWAESYDRSGTEVADLPGEAAHDIASRLDSALAAPSPAHSVSPEAQDAYLRGRYFLDKRDADKSAAYFQQAISIDPSWSQAYSGLGEALISEAVSDMMPFQEAIAKSAAAARRAIELDPQNGEPYSALGIIEGLFGWNWTDAEQNLKRGIALSPGISDAELQYANYLVAMNRTEEAVTHMRRALKLDPQSFMMNRQMGSILYFARHYDEALVHLQQAAEMEPGKLMFVTMWESRIYESQGMRDKAVNFDILDTADNRATAKRLRSIYEGKGWSAYWEARMTMMLAHENALCTQYDIAINDVRLGKPDLAFPRIKAAIDQKCWEVSWLMADPMMDGIRNDPRYNDLLRSMNLPH